MLEQNSVEGPEIAHKPSPSTDTAFPIVNIPLPTRMLRLLQLLNLHWHMVITHGPAFSLGFTFDVAHFVGLDKCVMNDMWSSI